MSAYFPKCTKPWHLATFEVVPWLGAVLISIALLAVACSGILSQANEPTTQQVALDSCAANLAKTEVVQSQAAKLKVDPAVLARRVCDTALLGIAVLGANIRNECPPGNTAPADAGNTVSIEPGNTASSGTAGSGG